MLSRLGKLILSFQGGLKSSVRFCIISSHISVCYPVFFSYYLGLHYPKSAAAAYLLTTVPTFPVTPSVSFGHLLPLLYTTCPLSSEILTHVVTTGLRGQSHK